MMQVKKHDGYFLYVYIFIIYIYLRIFTAHNRLHTDNSVLVLYLNNIGYPIKIKLSSPGFNRTLLPSTRDKHLLAECKIRSSIKY